MIDHQRSVLNTLGIDLWIPRDAVCVATTVDSIWRDQASAENAVEMFEFSVASVPAVVKIKTQSAEILAQPTAQLEKGVHAVRHLAKSVESSLSSEHNATASREIVATSVQQDRLYTTAGDIVQSHFFPAFQLQAMVFAQCTVVTNTTDFTAQHWALWQSMQQVLAAQTMHLEWPFPLLDMQDTRGVVCYIQGFLDAAGLDRPMFILGDIPHMPMHSHWEKIPSIQQLLDQPLLKRQLWQRIYQE